MLELGFVYMRVLIKAKEHQLQRNVQKKVGDREIQWQKNLPFHHGRRKNREERKEEEKDGWLH